MEHVLRTRIKARDEYSQRTFLYSWFIACLSHDFGYLFEESDIYKQFVGKIETGGIDAFYNEFISSPPDGRIFKSYTYEQVDYYFRKRAKEFHCIDHGIVGGILLYTNLLKALEEWKCLTKVPGNSSLRYYHDRLFRIPMNPRKYFAEFADSIISHNIFIKKMNQWRANDQMEDLKHKPFSMKYKRLAFILGLADTLEPIKRFDYNPSCLDHISIEIKNNDRIVITCDENINTTNYFLGIKDMEGWLNVKVVACNRSITIILI